MGKITIKTKKKKLLTVAKNKVKYPEVVNLQLLKLIENNYYPQFKNIELLKYKENKKAILRCCVQDLSSLKDLFSQPVDELLFYRIVYDIIRVIQFCEAEMLNTNNLDLREELIFYEPNLQKVYFIYWPVVNNSIYVKPRNFFLNLSQNIQFKNNLHNDCFKKYMDYLETLTAFSLNNFARLIQSFIASNSDGRTGLSTDNNNMSQPNLDVSVVKRDDLTYNPFHNSIHRDANSVSEGTTILSDSCFSGDLENMPNDSKLRVFLLQRKFNRRIEVDSEVFSIGKSSDCNFTVPNNAISRVHAMLFNRDGRIYLRDNDSTNKSFIEGKRLVPGKDYELLNGSRFKLANEDFSIIITVD